MKSLTQQGLHQLLRTGNTAAQSLVFKCPWAEAMVTDCKTKAKARLLFDTDDLQKRVLWKKRTLRFMRAVLS